MSQVVYSYIGKEPVESPELRCTIYPMPDYNPPKFMKGEPKPYKGEFKRESNKSRPNTWNHGHRDKIIAWLRENGPATCIVIANAIDTRTRTVERCLWNNRAKLFCVVGVTDDEYQSYIYGLNGQSLADMKIDCRQKRVYQIVADALRELGEARATELAAKVGINLGRVRFALSFNRDLFTCTKIGNNDFLWTLKETV